MKAGLKPGQTADLEITVDKNMIAGFNGQTVHELYSTSSLVHHLEWVARQTILPYLEEHEEGMGSHIDITHTMIAIPGMKIQLKALVTEVSAKNVVCRVEASHSQGQIAHGTITQAIIKKESLNEKINHMKQKEKTW
ncbi:MAG: hypothetical protein K2W82_08865 [Candidatus Obscuribacterales bacterium]|nr:hypothetical protein [Candidatus Obscuribacterales bacterium]